MSSYMNESLAAEPNDAYLQQESMFPLYMTLSINIYFQVGWTLHEPLKIQRCTSKYFWEDRKYRCMYSMCTGSDAGN